MGHPSFLEEALGKQEMGVAGFPYSEPLESFLLPHQSIIFRMFFDHGIFTMSK